MKQCSMCHQTKPTLDFHKKGDGLKSNCKSCQKTLHKRHYEANKSKIIKKVRKRAAQLNKENQALINQMKSKPCMDCGIRYHPFVMDFDHRDGTEKVADISKLVKSGYATASIITEIKKCDLVCSNCHRLRTLKRMSWVGSAATAPVL